MKKEVTEQRSVCNFCEVTMAHYQCRACKKDICWECVKTRAKTYAHSLDFSGSDDGVYCLECDEKLRGSDDELHKAYREIASLELEEAEFYADFKVRKDEAELNLNILLEKENQ